MIETAIIHTEVTRPALPKELAANFSIEVHPRTAKTVADFRQILPEKTHVFISHVGGTSLDDMVATAQRLSGEGFSVTPHVVARSIANLVQFERLIYRYRDEAGVRRALVLAGESHQPAGELHSSLQLLRSGLFDQAGYTDIFVAGHPEGNRDIDPDGGDQNCDSALHEKWQFSHHSDARMALLTQFVFSHQPIITWAEKLKKSGIWLPIHVGLTGPARLQTLLKYALSCGIGPSVRALKSRRFDISRLLSQLDQSEIVKKLECYRYQNPQSMITNLHIYPLGGIKIGAEWGKSLANRDWNGRDP